MRVVSLRTIKSDDKWNEQSFEKNVATPPHYTYTLEGVQVWKKGHWNKKRTVSILMNPLSTQLLVNPRVANVNGESCETAFYGTSKWFSFLKER